MRMGLPRMLAISFALHFCVVLIVVGFHLHASARRGSLDPDPLSKTSLVFTVRTKAAPDRQSLLSDNLRADSQAPASSDSDPLSPFPAIPHPVPPPTPAFALKQDAKVHVRWPAESPLNPSSAPHLNGREGIVFVLDISGSMYEAYAGSTRLAVARQILTQRLQALKNGTPFAIVVYGETTRRSGPLVAASDATREAAIQFINRDYDCGGGTDLPAGLACAEELQMGAVLLVTDGDLNANANELLPKVSEILGDSTSMTVIGISPRPKTNARELLQGLADQEGGSYLVARNADSPDLLTTNKPEAAAQ